MPVAPMSDLSRISVTVYDREFTFSCEPQDEAHLRLSAETLDRKMREISEPDDSNRILSVDKIAISAALNIVSELLRLNQENTQINERMKELIAAIRNSESDDAA